MTNRHKLVALLDVDGVLADFLSPVMTKMNEITGADVKYDDVTTWKVEDVYSFYDDKAGDLIWEIIKQPGFCESLKMYPGADDFVYHLSKMFDVYFVTAPCDSPTWVAERNIWLCSHLGEEYVKKTVYTKNKHLVKGDLFIDDSFNNCTEWQESFPTMTSVLWTQPYNKQHRPPKFRMSADFELAASTIDHLFSS